MELPIDDSFMLMSNVNHHNLCSAILLFRYKFLLANGHGRQIEDLLQEYAEEKIEFIEKPVTNGDLSLWESLKNLLF